MLSGRGRAFRFSWALLLAPGQAIGEPHMLSYVHDASDVPLIGQRIGECSDTACETHADTEVLVSCQQSVGGPTESCAATSMSWRALGGRGLRKGDRIGIWSANNAEWARLQFATAKVGAILVTINPAYRAGELAYALRQSGCRALVLAPSFRMSNYVAILADVRSDCPELEWLCNSSSISRG
jgi:fatty-acyl-CoA synthase